MSQYTCENCNQIFNKLWSDEEAKKEYESSSYYMPNEEVAVICDDCFIKFKKWVDSLTEEDHKRIKNA